MADNEIQKSALSDKDAAWKEMRRLEKAALISAWRERNREKLRQAERVRYNIKRNEIFEKQRQYRATNEAKIKSRTITFARSAETIAKISDRRAVWYEENREKILAQKADYYKNNRDKILKKNRDLYIFDAELRRRAVERATEWARSNPDRVRVNGHNQRERKRKSGRLSTGIVDLLRSEQGGKCAACFEVFVGNLYDIDHVIPLSRGGTNTDNNVELLCIKCNMRKSCRHPVEFFNDVLPRILGISSP